MKFIILGDCHLGARGGAINFANYFNRFFTNSLYPYMEQNGITQIFQLGDLWDNRTALPLKAFDNCKSVWFDTLVDRGYTMHTLLGNHDITLRESLSINTTESALRSYIQSGHVKVYKHPTKIQVEGATIDIIPWICKENSEAVKDFMSRRVVSELCLGHFEIEGASMYRGIASQGGLNQNLFERYERVFSGHYHTRSELMDGKIQYVGTPYEITWMDAHDPRGFTVFDTETREFEFVLNTETIFQKIFYRGNDTTLPQDIREKYVKLIVEKKEDIKKFDVFLNSLRLQSPEDVMIIENLDEWKDGRIDEDETIDIDDTLTIISKYIDSLTTDVDKEKVKAYMNGLYMEAISQ